MPDWVHMVTSADKIPGLTTEEALANLKRGIRERKCRYCAHLIQDVSNDEEFTCALMHSVGHEPNRKGTYAAGMSAAGHGYLAIRQPKVFGCTMWEANK
jgi:hypothetical protein